MSDESKPLRLYTPAEIPARLEVLFEKRRRIFAYDDTCAAGAPDVGLLDEKQRVILAARGQVGAPFPLHVQVSLGRAIDYLQSRQKFAALKAAA